MKTESENATPPSGTTERDCDQCVKVATAAATPFKLEKILVPVDFSDCSKKALQYAVPFACQSKAEMIFLHVLTTHYATGWEFEVGSYDPSSDGEVRKDVEQRIADLIAETVPGNIATKIDVRHGTPANEIVNAAKEMDVSLIIMSTHGHTGRVHAFIGSVAGDVTRLAPCPVLVVREHEHEFIPSQTNPFKTNQSLPKLTSTHTT
ncbi:MAG: universal stress protein [Verrucomicrobiota bacterium]|jgi:nucleotide-binding universal stress UspA family protein